ncbi:serine hydrolase domain-containing protein [Microbacterium pygmaeum]|uniref:LPXTG-motif cell wall anchor domain-containing protein n=1 Tax=Microbacterium pygmaeum TaxID=370764 RepID=A0A1G7Y3Y8_9MICO|nr:serine hydrolase domain-containing protein [Microbacterium pygmaeum]SDG91134.1 LPXTG-motif cell wall anchor domain-containing protein [Microbacterium pygmaeum]
MLKKSLTALLVAGVLALSSAGPATAVGDPGPAQLSADPTTITVGGSSTVTASNLESGATAYFSTSPGGSLSAQQVAAPDGTAQTIFTASAAGTYAVNLGDGENTIATVEITVADESDPGPAELSADPTTIMVGGSSTVTATNLEDGATAYFSTSPGGSLSAQQAAAPDGTAQTIFTASAAGTYAVNLGDGENTIATVEITVANENTSPPGALFTHAVTPAGGYAADGAAGVNTAMSPELQIKIQERIDAFQKQYNVVGLSAVVVTRDPVSGAPVTTHFAAGSPTEGSSERVGASTQFEIASQTKVYTSDLLAYLVAEGRVSLDDTVQKYAPEGVIVPTWPQPDGTHTEITLRDLATHQAALPDSPENYWEPCDGVENCTNPLPLYTQEMLWSAVSTQPLLWEPGTNWLYSNFGFGLLGTILANVIDPTATLTDPPKYEQALRGAFLENLGMSSTTLGTGPRMATPYLTDTDHTVNTETFYWFDTNALAGMGGLVSDANDMVTWDKAHLGDIPADAPLGVRAMADTLAPQSTITTICQEPDPTTCAPATNFQMGLGWQLYPATTGMGVNWAFKNGGTTGFSSDTVLAPDQGLAVTALWNQGRPEGQNIELAPAILSQIVHFKPEKHILPATGADAAELLVPAFGGAALIAGGAALILIRRRRPGMSRIR